MFVDIHTHSIMLNDPRQRGVSRWTSPEELLAIWDKAGIAKGVVLPLLHHEVGTILQTNENVLDMTAKYPDRIIPFCNLDPRLHPNSAKTDFTKILNHYKSLGCKGVGELCCNLWWDDDRVLNMLAYIEKSGLPMIFHVAGVERGTYGLIDQLGLPKLEKVLQMFPKLNFIGHSMAIWTAISGDVTQKDWMGYPKGPVKPGGRLIDLLRKYPNLWGDISAGSGNNALTRDPQFGYWFMEEFQDRLLFGTDICGPGQATPQVDTLNNALKGGHITKTAYEKITHENAEKLLGLE
jgi:predicted TIM-barrel fold metal-dependent hydrolase